MIECKDFKLRAIQSKDYLKILIWHRSTPTERGFLNPEFSFYDISSIQNIYDSDNNDNITFIIVSGQDLVLGMIIIRIEWENRNSIIDIIMSNDRRTGYSIGFKALSEIIKYCKLELNIRRIEIKIADKNKVMQKAFKFFKADAEEICDIFNGKGDWDDKIKAYFSISQEEYEKNWEAYATRYVKKEIFASSKAALVLKDDAFFEGSFISYLSDSLLLGKLEISQLDNVIELASGDFTKYEKYDDIQRFGSELKGK
jgi:RimJ/RimL family protein N-acetyltransferase